MKDFSAVALAGGAALMDTVHCHVEELKSATKCVVVVCVVVTVHPSVGGALTPVGRPIYICIYICIKI